MESVPERSPEWYTEEERDRLLVGIFEMHPQWYTFSHAHLGQRAQLRLLADLEPSAPPHVNVRSTSGKG